MRREDAMKILNSLVAVGLFHAAHVAQSALAGESHFFLGWGGTSPSSEAGGGAPSPVPPSRPV